MSEIVRISNLEKTYRTDSETLTILKNEGGHCRRKRKRKEHVS